MAKTLKDAVLALQPVKAYVEGCMHSSKRRNIFCLVEASFDARVYSSRLSEHINVRVACADDEKLTHSRDTVERFVRELRTKYSYIRIFGIRDVDYSEYINHQMPNGILGTDERDLEMMVLKSTSFSTFLKSRIQDYDDVMQKCFSACRSLGYIRIFDEHIGRKCKVNKKVKISNVYDSGRHQYKENYEEILKDKYVANCQEEVSSNDIDDFSASRNLDGESNYRVCRGHDVLHLLGIVLGIVFHEKKLHTLMEENYSTEDFYATQLFNDIENYCTAFGIEAKVG